VAKKKPIHAKKGAKAAVVKKTAKMAVKKKSIQLRQKRIIGAAGKKAFRSSKIRKETFDLTFPKPEPPPIPRISVSEKLEVPSPAETESMARKKSIPIMVTALLGAGIITLIAAAIFLFVLQIGEFYSLGISVPVMVGFSILFYHMLETRGV